LARNTLSHNPNRAVAAAAMAKAHVVVDRAKSASATLSATLVRATVTPSVVSATVTTIPALLRKHLLRALPLGKEAPVAVGNEVGGQQSVSSEPVQLKTRNAATTLMVVADLGTIVAGNMLGTWPKFQ